MRTAILVGTTLALLTVGATGVRADTWAQPVGDSVTPQITASTPTGASVVPVQRVWRGGRGGWYGGYGGYSTYYPGYYSYPGYYYSYPSYSYPGYYSTYRPYYNYYPSPYYYSSPGFYYYGPRVGFGVTY